MVFLHQLRWHRRQMNKILLKKHMCRKAFVTESVSKRKDPASPCEKAGVCAGRCTGCISTVAAADWARDCLSLPFACASKSAHNECLLQVFPFFPFQNRIRLPCGDCLLLLWCSTQDVVPHCPDLPSALDFFRPSECILCSIAGTICGSSTCYAANI